MPIGSRGQATTSRGLRNRYPRIARYRAVIFGIRGGGQSRRAWNPREVDNLGIPTNFEISEKNRLDLGLPEKA